MEESDAAVGFTDGNDPLDGPLGSAAYDGAPDEGADARTLDFVRARFDTLKEERRSLQERMANLEHTLSIVQTAQTWSQGNVMSAEQAEKVKEVTALLQQAKDARQEAMNFSKVGKG